MSTNFNIFLNDFPAAKVSFAVLALQLLSCVLFNAAVIAMKNSHTDKD